VLIWVYSLRCIQVIAGVLGRAGEEGQRKRLDAAKTGEVTWQPPPGLGKPVTGERAKEAAASGERIVKPKVADEEDVLASIRRRQKFRSTEEDDDL
jgi:small subunit ribosomal protein S2